MASYKCEIQPSPEEAAQWLSHHDDKFDTIIAVFSWSDKGVAIIYKKA